MNYFNLKYWLPDALTILDIAIILLSLSTHPKLKDNYMRIIITILFLFIKVYSEVIEPIEIINLNPDPISKDSNKISLSVSDSIDLVTELKNARKFNISGIAVWFTGLGLQLLSVPLLVEDNNSGIGLLVPGFALEIIAPAISCYGSDKSWNAVLEYNQGFERHNGWRYYKQGWILTGLEVGVVLVGTILISNGDNDNAQSVIAGCTTGLSTILNLAARISFGRSLFASNKYSRQVFREYSKHQFKVQE